MTQKDLLNLDPARTLLLVQVIAHASDLNQLDTWSACVKAMNEKCPGLFTDDEILVVRSIWTARKKQIDGCIEKAKKEITP